MEASVPYTAGTAMPNVAHDGYVDIRSQHHSRIIFRYDPINELVEWRSGLIIEVIDLKQYK